MAVAATEVDGSRAKMRVRVGDIEGDSGTGTCVTNAVTINRMVGVITTEALTTAAAATQAITLTSDHILAGDMVFASVDPGASTGTPTVANIAVSASTAVILLQNIHSATALNAAIKISFMVIKPRSTVVPL